MSAARRPRRGPAWRGPRAAALALGLALGLVLTGGPGGAAYILYYHTFGDWSVVCWRGLAAPVKSCFIDAPAISLDEQGRRSALRISAAAGGAVTLTVSARSGTALGTSVIVMIDDNPIHVKFPDRLDHVIWTGAEADAIIEQLWRGRELWLYFPGAPEGTRELRLSLEGFAAALDAFHGNLSRFGISASPANAD